MQEIKKILSARAVRILMLQFISIRIWSYWIVSHSYSSPDVYWWTYGPSAAACLLLFIVGNRKRDSFPLWATGVLCGISAVCLIAISDISFISLGTQGTAVCFLVVQFCLELLAVRCLLDIASLSIQEVLFVITIGSILSTLADDVFSYVLGSLSPFLVCLLPFTALMEHPLVEESGQRSPLLIKGDSPSIVLGPCLPFACVVFVQSLLNIFLKYRYGSWAFGDAPMPFIPLIGQALATLCLLFIIWWVFERKGQLNFFSLLKVPVALMALALVMVVIMGDSPALQVLGYGTALILQPFIWLITIDMIKHCDIAPLRIASIGLMVFYLPYFGGRLAFFLASNYLPFDSALTADDAVILLGILFLSFLLASNPNNQVMKVLLSDVNNRMSEVTDYKTIEERCVALAKNVGLSDREMEIAIQLAKGKSKPFIAESLCLSDNTIRTYSKRIYTKLGIHSVRELQEMVGVY